MASDRANPETLQSELTRAGKCVQLTQDGVGEKLLLQGRVPGVADDERPEDRSNTSSRPRNSNGGSSGSDELGSGVNVLLGGGGAEEVGGLHGGGPHAPPGGHAEAGRDGQTGDSRHGSAGVVEWQKI